MKNALEALASEKVLLLDGAMGTMIQRHKLSEEDYRGEEFAQWGQPVQGNNDLLNLTQPEIIRDIHLDYLKVGADLLETNTFNANSISMADYGMENYVYQINKRGAELANEAVERYQEESGRPAFVVGSIGPTNQTASLSPDVNRPGYRAVDYSKLQAVYAEQVAALMDGGADALLVETVFDTLNAKAALSAIRQVYDERSCSLPVMISGTITDASGRTLSGQTAEAFLVSVSHFPLFSIGFNCALGADQLLPYIQELARKAPFHISAHPNAGLPNAFGEYDEGPDEMGEKVRPFLEMGLVNIIGGCCGTTPAHIQRMDELRKSAVVRNPGSHA